MAPGAPAHPIVIPPLPPEVPEAPKMAYLSFWTEKYGWVTVIVTTEPVPTPSEEREGRR
jgi:hypothetical protein